MAKLMVPIGDRREKKVGSTSGVRAQGGSRGAPFSFVSNMKKGGKSLVLGSSRPMLWKMSDEQKQALKKSREVCTNEEKLDAQTDLTFDYKQSKPVEQREFKRTTKPYFNRKVYAILLKATNMDQALQIAGDKDLCNKYLAILESKINS